MPEIAEVAIYAESIRKILDGNSLQSMQVIGGKYYQYEVLNSEEEWVDKIVNPKTGRLVNIKPKEYPGGRYKVKLDGLDELNADLPLRVLGVFTKGKYCWIELDHEWQISITFGMSGSIRYPPIYDENCLTEKKEAEIFSKHFHVEFVNDTDHRFYFTDPRRFGHVRITRKAKYVDQKLQRLGVDLLQTSWTSENFRAAFRKSDIQKHNVCKILMSQYPVAGIGNYLLNEILYRCKISPWAIIRDLSDEDLDEMFRCSVLIIRQSADMGGTTLYTFSDSQGNSGNFQSMLQVYQKSHDPLGNLVVIIPALQAPDRRTKHYVPEIQTRGLWHPEEKDVKIKAKIEIEEEIEIEIEIEIEEEIEEEVEMEIEIAL